MRPEGDPPLCECHGVPMLWNKDSIKKSGGSWNCRDKRRASQARYRKSEKGRANQAANNARRVLIGTQYFGEAKTVEEAETITKRGRELVADFKQRQREATDVACS